MPLGSPWTAVVPCPVGKGLGGSIRLPQAAAGHSCLACPYIANPSKATPRSGGGERPREDCVASASGWAVRLFLWLKAPSTTAPAQDHGRRRPRSRSSACPHSRRVSP